MLKQIHKQLFTQIDNTGLVLFRIVFGALIATEGFGAIATGWVRRTLVEPEFTFNFIGFEFLQPLPGNGMYFYFAILGVLGLCVMVGFKYRYTMLAYAIMWSGVYLMQKSSYNNHYYLMMLLCYIMAMLPAHKWLSVDSALNPKLKSIKMPRWCSLLIIAQIWLVFTYAAIAKIYPGWLDGTASRLFMRGKADYWLIGDFLQQDWVHSGMVYFGILFDLLIIPLFLWKRTRMLAFVLSLFFHLFNSVVFQIGIFPYMSIAFVLFFFSSETLIRRFVPKKPLYTGSELVVPKHSRFILGAMSIYLIIQLALPLRHWFIAEPVLWTEEGHRLSWRMMLRTKSGRIIFYTKDKNDPNATKKNFNYKDLLTAKQRRSIKTKADFIWQFAQRIHKIEAAKGNDVAVYTSSKLRVNDGEYYPFIDPDIDLASVPWDHFKHNTWILPAPENFAVPKKDATVKSIN